MKKSLVALAILGTFTGVASAATSVTLYGRVDVGYQRNTGDLFTGVKGLTQDAGAGGRGSANQSRFGIKGEEDLGNGLSGTFQLEGRFSADTGDQNLPLFDRESTVGLKGSFGHVRLGRSLSAMERGIGFVNIGSRAADVQTYASAIRYSNGLFYDYNKAGFNVGGVVTTKGGAQDNTIESAPGSKVSYGVHAGYTVGDLRLGAAYQHDGKQVGGNGAFATVALKNEFGVAASYSISPVFMGASYARGKNSDLSLKTTVIQGYLGTYFTPNDAVAIRGISRKATVAGNKALNLLSYGAGYRHTFSKRTSAYVNLTRTDNKVSDKKGFTWDVAVQHNF